MTYQLHNNILKGELIYGGTGFIYNYKDRLRVTLDDGKVAEIAIRIFTESEALPEWNDPHWIYAKTNHDSILIDRYSAFKRFNIIGKTEPEIRQGLIDTFLASWKLFSDPQFQIEGIDRSEINDIKKYIRENCSNWKTATHIFPKDSRLSRAIDVINGTVYFLLNKGENRPCGKSKVISDAIDLRTGITYVSASFSAVRENAADDVVRSSVAKEKKMIELFKGNNRIIQMKGFVEYQDKNNRYKARAIFRKFTCNVHTLINSQEYNLTNANLLSISCQMIEIVHLIQERGLVVRDVKLTNFLAEEVNGEWEIVCCDLEMFCKKNNKEAREDKGSFYYMSPKIILNGNINYKLASEDIEMVNLEITGMRDMWALGICLAKVLKVYEKELGNLTPKSEDKKAREAELVNNILRLSTKKDWLSTPTTNEQILVYNLLQIDPRKRFTRKMALDFANTYFRAGQV